MGVRFLKPGSTETSAELAREGVVFIDGLFDSEQVARARAELERYEREVLPTVTPIHNERYADGTLRCMHELHRYDPWFVELATRPELLDLVRAAVPWEPMLYYLETFPKPPGAGALPAHQELFTVPVDPPDFLHLWIALGPVTAANGGLAFYRRSHRLGLAPHRPEAGSFGVDAEVLRQLRPYRAEPDYPAGSAALFDCRTIHVSGANTSGRPRPVLVIAYRGTHTGMPSEAEVLASIIARFYREETGEACDSVDDRLSGLVADAPATTRVLTRIRASYGVDLPVAELTGGTPKAVAERVLELSA